MSLPRNTTEYRTPLIATALLALTLMQASTFNLSLAFRGPLASDALVSLITLLWLAMYALSAVGLFVSHGINWITWLVRYRLLLTLLLAGTVLSVSWSVAPSLSVERSIHMVGTTIIALYLGFSLPLNNMLKVSAAVLGFIMLSSIIAALTLPDLGLEMYQGRQVWTGTLASKNTLGFWAAITVLLCASLCTWHISRAQRLLYLVIGILALLCLYKSVSATSLLALFCAGLIMIYLHVTFSLRLGALAMALLGIFVIGLAGVAFHFIDTAELIGRSGDLTGRADVWAQTWALILERPLTGYGYGTLWFPTAETIGIQQSLTDFSWTVFHAHNGLLQIASEIGIPLTILAILMIVQQLIEIVYCQYQRQQPGVLFVMGFAVALLLSNYSEARLLVNRELYWVFFIALPISMLMQVSLVSEQSASVPNAGVSSATGAQRLRALHKRKAEKNTLKKRMRNQNKVKVINPDQTRAINDEQNAPMKTAHRDQVDNDQGVTFETHQEISDQLRQQGRANQKLIANSRLRAENNGDLIRQKKTRRLKR